MCNQAFGFLLLSIFALIVGTIVEEPDFYQLLGVTRDADTREIRKGFKKVALTAHPDKNTVSKYIYFVYFFNQNFKKHLRHIATGIT